MIAPLSAGATDPLWEQEPLLAQISAASVQGMVATGDRAGRKDTTPPH